MIYSKYADDVLRVHARVGVVEKAIGGQKAGIEGLSLEWDIYIEATHSSYVRAVRMLGIVRCPVWIGELRNLVSQAMKRQ